MVKAPVRKTRDQIEHVMNYIPLATIQKVYRSVQNRCWECTMAEGGHVEHVRAKGSLRKRT